MTNEQAIKVIKRMIKTGIAYDDGYAFEPLAKDEEKACGMAIEALEQEKKTVSIPDGATNGDVFTIMFNKTFSKTIVVYENDKSRLTINPIFSREWWETPYKAESEEE